MYQILGRLIQASIAFLLFGSTATLACTCVDPGRDSEDKVIDAMCAVDVLFIGKATGLTTTRHGTRHLRIAPITVYKGNVSIPLIVETATTCDHWFDLNQEYLIFGNLDSELATLSTSICGSTRFTAQLERAQFQHGIVKDYSTRIGTSCGSAESGARQIRIIRQDRADNEQAEAESLRFLKESLKQSRDDYEDAIESARSTQENDE